jgi:hypothetical protein
VSASVLTVEPPANARTPGPIPELVDIVVAEAKTGGNRRQRQEVEHFTDGGPTINQPKDPKKRLSDRVIGAG